MLIKIPTIEFEKVQTLPERDEVLRKYRIDPNRKFELDVDLGDYIVFEQADKDMIPVQKEEEE